MTPHKQRKKKKREKKLKRYRNMFRNRTLEGKALVAVRRLQNGGAQ